jgi:hypothetical protein
MLMAIRLYQYVRAWHGYSESPLDESQKVRAGAKHKINNVLAHLKFTGKIKAIGEQNGLPIWKANA